MAPKGVEKMAKTMLMQEIATARDKLMAFFYFKVDRNGTLQYAVILLDAQTLKKKHIFGGFDHTKSRLKNIPNLAEVYHTVYNMLDNRIWIGLDILNQDIPLWEKACEEIGKKSPTPKSIIDIRSFLSSDSKIAKIALEFGICKKVPCRSIPNCKMILGVIKHCGKVMPLFVEKEYVDGLHPVISHIIDHSDLTADFGHLEIGSCSAGDLTRRPNPCWSSDLN